MYAQLSRTYDPFHWLLMGITVVVLLASVALAASGVSMAWCLVVLSAAPWVTVVGYELRGHEHNEKVLAEARAQAAGH